MKKFFKYAMFFVFLTSINISTVLAQPSTEEIKDMFNGNITCGGITNFYFPEMVPNVTSTVYNILKIAVPVILVIMGMMDMFKATTAGKEDEMKKAQKKFIQRIVAGICALLVFVIVEFVVSFIADKTNNSGAMDCVNCFINGDCVEFKTETDSEADSETKPDNFTCSSGYTLVNNKICIKFGTVTYTTGYVPRPQCSGDYTLTDSLSGFCIKVESAKNNGTQVINSGSLSCETGHACKFGTYSFSITGVSYTKAGQCSNGYKEIKSGNSYYCVK